MTTDQATGRRTAPSEYAQYACLDELLNLQWPKTEAPAELSFIIVTQVMELYFKLLSHEWGAACAKLDADDVRGAIVDLRRSHGVQDALTASWEALRTLTPAEFDEFRESFGAASGIQSELYRDLEQALGVPYPSRGELPNLAARSAALLERRGLGGWRELYAQAAAAAGPARPRRGAVRLRRALHPLEAAPPAVGLALDGRQDRLGRHLRRGVARPRRAPEIPARAVGSAHRELGMTNRRHGEPGMRVAGIRGGWYDQSHDR